MWSKETTEEWVGFHGAHSANSATKEYNSAWRSAGPSETRAHELVLTDQSTECMIGAQLWFLPSV